MFRLIHFRTQSKNTTNTTICSSSSSCCTIHTRLVTFGSKKRRQWIQQQQQQKQQQVLLQYDYQKKNVWYIPIFRKVTSYAHYQGQYQLQQLQLQQPSIVQQQYGFDRFFTTSTTTTTSTTNNKSTIQNMGEAYVVAESFLDPSSSIFVQQQEKESPSVLQKTTTQLTTVRHKAPARLIPVTSTNVAKAGAAAVALSNYGGGLVAGDTLVYNITSKGQHSKLLCTTQGSNRVYRQRHRPTIRQQNPQTKFANNHTNKKPTVMPSRSVMNISVQNGGTLVIAPDPISVFADSIYVQEQNITLDHGGNQNNETTGANLCLIDWISSGRHLSGEHWQQQSLHSTTSVFVTRDERMIDGQSSLEPLPILVDSIRLQNLEYDAIATGQPSSPSFVSRWGMKPPQTPLSFPGSDSIALRHPWHAYASMLLYGPEMSQVVQRCHDIQSLLIQPYTPVRQPLQNHHNLHSIANSSIKPIDQINAMDHGQTTFTNHTTQNNYNPNPSNKDNDTSILQHLPFLSGRVVMGITRVSVFGSNQDSRMDGSTHHTTTTTATSNNGSINSSLIDGKDSFHPTSDLFVVRFTAMSNEDIYRIFHSCLLPLKSKLGIEIYKDRIRSVSSTPLQWQNRNQQQSTQYTSHQQLQQNQQDLRQKILTDYNNNGQSQSMQPQQSKHLQQVPLTPLTPLTQQSQSIEPNHMRHTNDSSPLSSNFIHDNSYWAAYILADSALPTGSFAYSSGLEAMNQLQFILRTTATDDSDNSIALFVQSATQSIVQQSTPFVLHCFELLRRLRRRQQQQFNVQQGEQPQQSTSPLPTPMEQFLASWKILDQHAHIRLVSNGPACRTSLDQGRSLLRVAMQFHKTNANVASNDHFRNHSIRYDDGTDTYDDDAASAATTTVILQGLLDEINKNTSNSTKHERSVGHLSTVFGVVTAVLQLNEQQACFLLGYCASRDIVSAAVRLNLIGPMASVNVLTKAQRSTEDGFYIAKNAMTAAISQYSASVSNHSASSNSNNEQSLLQQNEEILDDFTIAQEIAAIASASSSCAPLLDSIQPCHDTLASRLFRT